MCSKIKQKAVLVFNDNKKEGITLLNTLFDEGYLLKDKQFIPEEEDVYSSVIFILEKNENI